MHKIQVFLLFNYFLQTFIDNGIHYVHYINFIANNTTPIIRYIWYIYLYTMSCQGIYTPTIFAIILATFPPQIPFSSLNFGNYKLHVQIMRHSERGMGFSRKLDVHFEVLSCWGKEQGSLRCEPLSLCTEITSASIYI